MILLAALMLAQAQFDVATIKPSDGTFPGSHTQFLPGGRMSVENQTLRTMIKLAYKVQDWQVSGAPGWVNSDLFNVEAKAEGNPPPLHMAGPMLQNLLEERFQLKTHREKKEMPIYKLSAAKSGLKIQPIKEGDCEAYDPNVPHPKICGSAATGPKMLTGTGISMETLTKSLAYMLGRTVIDNTSFKALFDVHLQFDDDGPTIFTALQEQLGLKLESAKGPVEVLVIDRVERPASN